MVSKEELVQLFPQREKKITDEDVELINQIVQDEDSQFVKGQLKEYCNVILNERNTPLSEFLCAIKFISLVNAGMSQLEAYKKVFAYTKHVQEWENNPLGVKAKAYAKSRVVLMIAKEADFPLDLLYQGYKYQAIEVLRQEMLTSKLSRDKIQAANILLTHLSPKLEQNINFHFSNNKPKSAIDIYKEALEKLAEEQSKMIDTTIDNESKTNIINIKLVEKDREE